MKSFIRARVPKVPVLRPRLSPRQFRVIPQLECLESRCTPAVTASIVNQGGGALVLTVEGDNDNNVIALRLKAVDNTMLEVDVANNGTADFTFDRDDFNTIHVIGGAGNDNLLSDDVNGVFTDTFTVLFGTAGDDTLTGTSGGEILVGGAGNDVLTGGPGDDRYDFHDGWGADTIIEIAADTGIDSVDFTQATTGLLFTLGIDMLNPGLTAANVTDGTNAVSGLLPVESWSGGEGNDTMALCWVLDPGNLPDPDLYTVLSNSNNFLIVPFLGVHAELGSSYGFGFIENVSDNGVQPHFTFGNGSSLAGTITGTDITLDYSAFFSPVDVNLATNAATAVNDEADGGINGTIATVIGSGDETDVLTGPDGDSNWAITSTDAGNVNGVTAFSSIANLNGGAGNDVFVINDSAFISGSIAGGGGTNTLDYGGWTHDLAVSLDSSVLLLAARLDGAQEDPPVTTAGMGTAAMLYDFATNKFSLEIFVRGISASNVIDMHLHVAPLGVDGPIIVPLPHVFSVVPGGILLRATGLTLPVANENDLFLGNTYLNVHTKANPGGEIRGQMLGVSVGSATGVGVSISAIQNVIGGSGNDSFMGSSAANVLVGNAGDDILVGADADDVLSGGAGFDLLDGGAGTADVLTALGDFGYTLANNNLATRTNGGALVSTDALFAIESADLVGGAGNNQINAAAFTLGPVTLAGEDGDDVLRGGSKADQLIGGSGNDSLLGNAGNDSLAGEDGNDLITGGAGTDRVLNALTNGSVLGSLTLSNTKLITRNDLGEIIDTDTLAGMETATLMADGTGPASLNASAFSLGSVMIVGGIGDDTINGGTRSDVLSGGAGNDILNGNAGNDNLDGGDNDDRLNGGGGKDTLKGLNGDDSLSGSAGADNLDGGVGSNQLIEAGNFTFLLTVTTLTSRNSLGVLTVDVLGNIQAATLTGGAGNNKLDATGFTGPATLNGSGGNDTLTGGSGNDSISGGTGKDRLNGADGVDTLDGGTGVDTGLNGETLLDIP